MVDIAIHPERTPMTPDDAREQLVHDNLRLAYYHARRLYRPGGLDVEDLEQEAVMGLMAAAGLYRPAENPQCPFSSFSRQYIVRHVNEAIRRWEKCRADPLFVDLPDPSADPGRDRLALEIWDMLEHVPRACRALVVRRYGLDGEEPMGLIELSEHFGLPARTVGRQLAVGREIVRAECHARGFSVETYAQRLAAEIA
jgi:RNA polymerase sigma factor (sigma-70 family)